MDYQHFQISLERSIIEILRKCHPASWDENHISFSLVDGLFDRHRVQTIEGLDRPFKIIWDFRKLRLPEESDFGDIAVLVRLTTSGNEHIEGVGFLEAKRRALGSNSLEAANTAQLERIRDKAASAQLLIYDYENVTSCMDNVPRHDLYHHYTGHGYPVVPFTHAVCVPMATAIQQGKYTTDLHKFGVPLSYQLSARYFRGFDLEMADEKLNAIKGNIAKHGGPRNILLVGVSTGSADPILPIFNNDRYVDSDF